VIGMDIIMTCDECGAEISEEALICPECNAALKRTNDGDTPCAAPAPPAEPDSDDAYDSAPARPTELSSWDVFDASTPPAEPDSDADHSGSPRRPTTRGKIKKTLIPTLVAAAVVILFSVLWLAGVFTHGNNEKDPASPTLTDGTPQNDIDNEETSNIDTEEEEEPQPTAQPPEQGGEIPGEGWETEVTGAIDYAFTPDQTGPWQLLTYNNYGSKPCLTLLNSDGMVLAESKDVLQDANSIMVIKLFEGVTYTIRAGFCNNDTGKYTLSVSPADMIPGYGEDIRINGTTGCLFTPDQAGIWELRASSDGVSDPYMKVYEPDDRLIAEDDDSGGGFDALVSVNLNPRTVYTIIVGFYESDSYNCTLTLSLTAEAETGISTQPQAGSQLPVDGGSLQVTAPMDFTFAPDQDGVWIFTALNMTGDDPFLSIQGLDGTLVTEYGAGRWDHKTELFVYLFNGAAYKVSADYYGEGIDSSYMLNVVPPTLLSGNGGQFQIIDGDAGLIFVPDQSGSWEFRTSNNGSCDPYIIIYSQSGKVVGEDDDGAGNSNALATVKLTAEETYIIRAGYHSFNPDNYTLTVTRK